METKISKQNQPLWKRILKVWFLTVLTGYISFTFLNPGGILPGVKGFDEFLALFGIVLLLALPALFLTAISLKIVNAIEHKGRKILMLFFMTLLINLVVYLFIFRFVMSELEILWPFSVSSFIMMFLINRDWISLWIKSSKVYDGSKHA